MPPTAICVRNVRQNTVLAVTTALLLMLVGCQPGTPSKERPQVDREGKASGQTAEISLNGVTLRLLVVGDPAMATAIEQLRGEWNARTGSTLEVQQAAESDAAAVEPKSVDVVICPSYHLPLLAEKRLIVPIPAKILQEARGSWNDLFSLLRTREAAWGGQTVAVPMGSPVLTYYYRADLLEKLGARPPKTWAEVRALAASLADRKRLGDAAVAEDKSWSGSLQPLGPGWAGLVLLARAAPYAVHPSAYSTLFRIDTMEPLIDGPPFVRALEELVAEAKTAPAEQLQKQLQMDPTAVRHAFWRGECGLAMSWPSAADKALASNDPKFRVGFLELPGSADLYSLDAEAWEVRGKDADRQVPLLDVAGRLGTVTVASSSPEAAFRLLFWLCGEQGLYVSGASPSTTLYRNSHAPALSGPSAAQAGASRSAADRAADAGSSQAWVERGVSAAAAAQYAQATQHALSHPQALFALRIPGRNEYLAALDHAVARAVRGEQSAKDALRAVSVRWREITQRLGVDPQRAFYRHSMGI